MRFFAAVVVFAALVAAASAASAASEKVPWADLRVKWSALGPIAATLGTGFFSMPKTAADANKEGWVQAKEEALFSVWCMTGNPRVCMLYDLQGTIAGIQLGYPLADMAGTPFDYKTRPLYFEDTLLDIPVAAGRAFFVPQEVLESGGRAEMGSEVGTGLWFQSGDGFVEVPQDGSKLEALGWTKENCIPTMGRHYYFNTTKEMDCHDLDPYFILTDNSKNWVKGFGFQSFGRQSSKEKLSREWTEFVPAVAIKPTVPTAPQCLVDWADKYGILSVHVYFTKNPHWYIC